MMPLDEGAFPSARKKKDRSPESQRWDELKRHRWVFITVAGMEHGARAELRWVDRFSIGVIIQWDRGAQQITPGTVSIINKGSIVAVHEAPAP